LQTVKSVTKIASAVIVKISSQTKRWFSMQNKMWSKKEFIHAVYRKNVAIVRSPSAKKNTVNVLTQAYRAQMHVNVPSATIENLWTMRKKGRKGKDRQRGYCKGKVFYRKVWQICNICDLKSFNLLFIKIVLSFFFFFIASFTQTFFIKEY
jgi:hypothetical protein